MVTQMNCFIVSAKIFFFSRGLEIDILHVKQKKKKDRKCKDGGIISVPDEMTEL